MVGALSSSATDACPVMPTNTTGSAVQPAVEQASREMQEMCRFCTRGGILLQESSTAHACLKTISEQACMGCWAMAQGLWRLGCGRQEECIRALPHFGGPAGPSLIAFPCVMATMHWNRESALRVIVSAPRVIV